MSWPDRERYSFPLQSLVVSLLLSLVSTLVFSRTKGLLSHRNSSTHRFPRFPLRNLCSFSLGFAESRIFPAAPGDTVPGHLSSHSALSSYGIFAALALWRLSVSIRFLYQALGSCPASEAPWFSAMPPSIGRGQVKTTTTSRCIELKL